MRMKSTEVAPFRAKLYRLQGGLCAMCQKPMTLSGKDAAVLDHNHTTGVVRGVAHRSCNGVEGKLLSLAKRCHAGVPPGEFLINLGEYLRVHKKPQTTFIHPTHKTQAEKRATARAKANKLRGK